MHVDRLFISMAEDFTVRISKYGEILIVRGIYKTIPTGDEVNLVKIFTFYMLLPLIMCDCKLETFVDKIRQIQKKVEKPNQPARVLGVHFNISAYAPFEIVSRFFYNFVFFGLLWDESTGDMEYIQDNIHWIVSYHFHGLFLKMNPINIIL
jgi:hypothetical protein